MSSAFTKEEEEESKYEFDASADKSKNKLHKSNDPSANTFNVVDEFEKKTEGKSSTERKGCVERLVSSSFPV